MSNNKNTEANVEMTSEELSEVLQVRSCLLYTSDAADEL